MNRKLYQEVATSSRNGHFIKKWPLQQLGHFIKKWSCHQETATSLSLAEIGKGIVGITH